MLGFKQKGIIMSIHLLEISIHLVVNQSKYHKSIINIEINIENDNEKYALFQFSRSQFRA